MVAPKDLYLFTPIILFIASFFFIFPFEAQHCYAWIVLETSSMSCFTCLGFLLFGDSQWFVYCFLVIDTCCAKGWKVAYRIFACKKDGLSPFIVFISHVVCLGLCCLVIIVCKKTSSKLIMGSYKNLIFYTIPFVSF
jgi:hypothetical protein